MFSIVLRKKFRTYDVLVFSKEDEAVNAVYELILSNLKGLSVQDPMVKPMIESCKKRKSSCHDGTLETLIRDFNEFAYLRRKEIEIGIVEAKAPLATEAMLRFVSSRKLENLL